MADLDPIPFGLCRCGCGRRTKLSTRNDYVDGYAKGEPRRFIRGHHTRLCGAEPPKNASGYVLIRDASHPWANCGDVMEHVLIVEKVLGRLLPSCHPIHHVDRNPANNRHDNLVVLQSTAEHNELHRKLRVLRAGGNPWTQSRCSGQCKRYKDNAEFYPTRPGVTRVCKACWALHRERVRSTRGTT